MAATTGTLTTSLTAAQRLKIDLMTQGMSVSLSAREALMGCEGLRPLTLADYASTSGVALEIGEDIWVNAPISEYNSNFVTEPSLTLDHQGDGFFIRGKGIEIRVNPLPVPGYYNERLTSGRLITDFAITHTDRVRISPIQGCSYVCTFCDLPYDKRYEKMPVEGLIQSVRRALEDEVLPAHHVLISGGVPKDEDWPWLNEVYENIAASFPEIGIDIMMVPVPGHFLADRLHEIGIHALFLNLELFSEEAARKIMPRKLRIGQETFLNVIEEAVSLFGLGRVYSLLLVGLEPMGDTLRGVQALAERGCDPVLSPFRPDPGTPLRNHLPPSAELLEEVYIRSVEIADREGVKLGPRCIPCMHNTLTFPDDSGLYYRTCELS
jgi:radical SAM family protein